MDLLKIVRNFYLSYTLYILLLIFITSLNLFDILPSIILMWFLYFVFSFGYKLNIKNNKLENISIYQTVNILFQKKIIMFVLAILSILSSIIAAHYYTGKTLTTTFYGLINHINFYGEYQQYAKTYGSKILSMAKIPYILMMFYFKLILYYSYIIILLVKNKIKRFDIFYLLCLTFSQIYFGIARGTNFELFELIILIIYIILLRNKNKSIKISLKNVIFLFSSIISMLFIFYFSVAKRGMQFNDNNFREFVYNDDTIFKYIPILPFASLLLYNYFGFGFVYLSIYFKSVWNYKGISFFRDLFPHAQNTLQNNMNQLIFLNTRWKPDVIIYINNYGFLGLIIIIFFLALFLKYIKKFGNTTLVHLTQLISLFQLISLPVGNFVFVSSATTLIVLFILFLWFWKIFIKVKIKIKTY